MATSFTFPESFALDGKVAVVTGSSKGLGLVFAHALASAGANVVLNSRKREEVESAAADVQRVSGRPCMGIVADVAIANEVDRLVRTAIDRFGKIDILVNNAGVNVRKPIQDLAEEDWQKMVDVNLTGPWLMCRAVASHMQERRYGRIINVSSALGLVGLRERTPYCATKGGLHLMTQALAGEMAPFSVTVNSLCPGPFNTPMNATLTDRQRSEVTNLVPMNRFGELREIAGPLVFLASDSASFVTGASLAVDGGWTAS